MSFFQPMRSEQGSAYLSVCSSTSQWRNGEVRPCVVWSVCSSNSHLRAMGRVWRESVCGFVHYNTDYSTCFIRRVVSRCAQRGYHVR